jgi:crossover junction endodeoxyribonuclease RuvC
MCRSACASSASIPGLQRTGFGIIEAQGAQLAYVASGTISTLKAPRGDLPLR